MEMRRNSAAVSKKAMEEMERRHEAEVAALKVELEQRTSIWEAKFEGLNTSRAESEQTVVALRAELLKVQIENEEKFTTFEDALRKEGRAMEDMRLKTLQVHTTPFFLSFFSLACPCFPSRRRGG